ncbi:MAG TPA: hypothetical protein VFC24_01440, partial [Casimicrobiaceae bacterium]|nr:hypothetical protein [Casimicrobiaceae bacterium]
MTWKGVGLIAVLCLLNAVRRTIQGLLNDPTGQGSYYTLLPWLRDTIAMAAAALVLALVVTLAVVATCNLTPSKPRLRYPMVALAVAASSLVGVIGQVIAEWPLFCRGETFEQCLGGAPISFILQNYVRYGSLCAFFTVVFLYVRAADESVRRADQAARDRARFMQRME